jgi:hypothetical protein
MVPEEDLPGDLGGDPGRDVPGLDQIHEVQIPLPFHLVRREVGTQQKIRKEAQGLGQARPDQGHAGQHGVVDRLGLELRSQSLEGLGDLPGGFPGSAFFQQVSRQGCQSRKIGGLGREAAREDHPQEHQGDLVALHQADLQPVGQREHLSRREVEIRFPSPPGHRGAFFRRGRPL